MTGLWSAISEGGPWAALLFVLISGTVGLVFTMSRGLLVRGTEVDRIERRMEKDTDRVLSLYVKQIDSLTEAGKLKDETIAKQADQIEKLMDANGVATSALDKIVKEAERRGHFPT